MPADDGLARLGVSAFLLALWVGLAGCTPRTLPPDAVLLERRFELGNHATVSLEWRAADGEAQLVLMDGDGIDLKIAAQPADGGTVVWRDAPNKRGGLELLAVMPGAARNLRLTVAGNDLGPVRGRGELTVLRIDTRSAAGARRLAALERVATHCANGGQDDIDDCRAAAAELESLGDLRFAGIARLHASARAFWEDWDLEPAGADARDAERLLRAAGDTEFATQALALRGQVEMDRAGTLKGSNGPAAVREAYARAREACGRAAAEFAAQGLPAEQGQALNFRGLAHYYDGQLSDADADYSAARTLFASLKDPVQEGITLQNLAVTASDRGELADAVHRFDAALQLLRPYERPQELADSLHNSAVPLLSLGRFDEAFARYFEAGQSLRAAGDAQGEARSLHGMAGVKRAAGEPERAIELLQQALPLRRAGKDVRGEVLTLVELGELLQRQGDTGGAHTLLAQASALAAGPAVQARALLALGRLSLAEGRAPDARASADTLLGLPLPANSLHHVRARVLLAEAQAALGERGEAEASYATAIRQLSTSGSELELARAHASRAAARLRAGQPQPALEDTRAALALYERLGENGVGREQRTVFLGSMREVVERQVEASLVLATAAEGAGRPAEAADLRELALQTSEQGRSRGLLDALAGAALGPVEANARDELYERLAAKRLRRDALLERHVDADPRIAELGREINELRARIDLLDGKASGASAGVETFAQASRYLPPAGVIVVEYLLGESRSWAFLRDASGLRVATLPAAAELEALARRVHLAWRQPGTSDDAAERALATALFAPLAGSAARSVWLVPDGALHIVPLAALAERHGLADRRWRLVPSIAATQRAPANPRAGDGPIWVLADPVYAREDPRLSSQQPVAGTSAAGARGARGLEGLQRLPASALEATAIRAQFGEHSTRVLTGTAADRDGFLAAAAAQPRILHLATHAWSDPEDAGLATLVLSLHGADGSPRNGALRAHEVARLRLPAELVVLSGCETGLGRRIVGEGPVGLAHAFLRAGARTVVASLWPVADGATAALMTGMYRGLVAEGLAPEEALAQAQAQLRSRPRWRSPYYWAGFQVVTLETGETPRLRAGSQ